MDESERTDEILAAYNEEHANFIASFLIVAELIGDLTDEEFVEYTRIGEKIDADHVEQREQQQIMIELEQVSSTAEERFEYVARLLANTEKCTEQLRSRADECSNLIRSHLSKTTNTKRSGGYIETCLIPVPILRGFVMR